MTTVLAIRKSPLSRISILLTLLCGEVALVASLHALGWWQTGSGLRWIGCLVAAALPLVVAVAMLCRHRLRFDLRTMLVVMALVATFLYLSVRPLQNALSSRRSSRSLLATGATLYTISSWDSVYAQLEYDPRPAAIPPINQRLSFWLRPLAGSLLNVPTDDSVREIWLGSNEQIAELCRNSENFSNLERITVDPMVTPEATQILLEALPTFAHLTDLQFCVAVQKDWLRSLPNIRTLSLWAEGPLAGRQLSDEQLRDIAALPDLRVLSILKYAVTDADAQILANSKTLKHVLLKKTAVTQSGADKLSAAMPGCVVHRD